MSAPKAPSGKSSGADPKALLGALEAAERRLFSDLDLDREEKASGLPLGTLAATLRTTEELKAAARAAMDGAS
jgi:hypothetical protein